MDYRKFWEPIRSEPNGLFAGKPSPDNIGKTIRGIWLALVVHNHACRVDLGFSGEEMKKRRSKAMKLFPAPEYPQELHESPKFAVVRFPVLDKGIKDRGDWDEIREKLTKLGTEIHDRIIENLTV